MSIFCWDEWDEAGYRETHGHGSRQVCAPPCPGYHPPPTPAQLATSLEMAPPLDRSLSALTDLPGRLAAAASATLYREVLDALG